MLDSLEFLSNNGLKVRDQRKIPVQDVWILLNSFETVCTAISNMTIRGAPLIGIVAAQGMALAHKEGKDLELAKTQLDACLPTAINLATCTKRLLNFTGTNYFDEVFKIAQEEKEACEAMANFGSSLLVGCNNIITHCNSGSLCTFGRGTALGAIIKRFDMNPSNFLVYVGETRPRLQGLKLTTFELLHSKVPFKVFVDSAAGSLIQRGLVDAVVFGADRICANGDVVNKIGSFPLALVAHSFGIPVICVAPTSTIDFNTSEGSAVEIEERDELEVLNEACEGMSAYNPAFDVTPFRLFTTIVTERGVCYPPFAYSLATQNSSHLAKSDSLISQNSLTKSDNNNVVFKSDIFKLVEQDMPEHSQSQRRFPQAKTYLSEGNEVDLSHEKKRNPVVQHFHDVKKSTISLSDDSRADEKVSSSIRMFAQTTTQESSEAILTKSIRTQVNREQPLETKVTTKAHLPPPVVNQESVSLTQTKAHLSPPALIATEVPPSSSTKAKTHY
jgi:methylthioribose-1-phosphate isomerase